MASGSLACVSCHFGGRSSALWMAPDNLSRETFSNVHSVSWRRAEFEQIQPIERRLSESAVVCVVPLPNEECKSLDQFSVVELVKVWLVGMPAQSSENASCFVSLLLARATLAMPDLLLFLNKRIHSNFLFSNSLTALYEELHGSCRNPSGFPRCSFVHGSVTDFMTVSGAQAAQSGQLD